MAKAKKPAKNPANDQKPAVKARKKRSKKRHAEPLAANRKRRRARAGAPLVANPPMSSDFVQVLIPGFGAYAATRVLSRVVYTMVQRRWPKFGKHAAALAGAASFGAVWFFAHKVKMLEKYHDGIVMGSGVGALHGLASCYLPKKYSWLLADCRPEDVQPKRLAPSATILTHAELEPGDEFSHLEAELEEMEEMGSTRSRTTVPPRASSRPVAAGLRVAAHHGGGGVDLDPDLAEALDLDEEVDDLYTGAFEN